MRPERAQIEGSTGLKDLVIHDVQATGDKPVELRAAGALHRCDAGTCGETFLDATKRLSRQGLSISLPCEGVQPFGWKESGKNAGRETDRPRPCHDQTTQIRVFQQENSFLENWPLDAQQPFTCRCGGDAHI